MHEMPPQKFVIYDGKLLLGRINFHKDLLPEGYDKSLVKGGGLFDYDLDAEIIYFYGESHDFGPFDAELVMNVPFEAREGRWFKDFKRTLNKDELLEIARKVAEETGTDKSIEALKRLTKKHES